MDCVKLQLWWSFGLVLRKKKSIWTRLLRYQREEKCLKKSNLNQLRRKICVYVGDHRMKIIRGEKRKKFCKLISKKTMNLWHQKRSNTIYSFVVFFRAKLEETKLVQKLRVKPNGVNAVALAIGQKVTTEDLVLKVWTIYKFRFFLRLFNLSH